MRVLFVYSLLAIVDLSLALTGCRTGKVDPVAEAPPPVHVETENFSAIQVARPEDFPLAIAAEIPRTPHSTESASVDSDQRETYAALPATAILRTHGRNWVYVPAGENRFRRVDVLAGAMLPGNMRLVLFGIKPGDRVVQNALVLQNTVEPK